MYCASRCRRTPHPYSLYRQLLCTPLACHLLSSTPRQLPMPVAALDLPLPAWTMPQQQQQQQLLWGCLSFPVPPLLIIPCCLQKWVLLLLLPPPTPVCLRPRPRTSRCPKGSPLGPPLWCTLQACRPLQGWDSSSLITLCPHICWERQPRCPWAARPCWAAPCCQTTSSSGAPSSSTPCTR